MLELQDQGALNVNLVTATHYAHLLPATIGAARRRGLKIPIVYNTSGYERVQAVAELCRIGGRVAHRFQIRRRRARSLSVPRAGLSGRRGNAALAQMVSQINAAGGELLARDGHMLRGIIVRHLVLPGHAEDSCRVLDRIWEVAGRRCPSPVMNQYTPNQRMRDQGGDLARAVLDEEYEMVLDHADDLGFTTMFWQEGGAVDESFTPPFDTTGVLESAATSNGRIG